MPRTGIDDASKSTSVGRFVLRGTGLRPRAITRSSTASASLRSSVKGERAMRTRISRRCASRRNASSGMRRL